MPDYRIHEHPILSIPHRKELTFYWNGLQLSAYEDETISAALIANGINIFGHHHKDNSPQGIFCANGQCAQCMVIANDRPVKSCTTTIQEGMTIFPANGLPALPKVRDVPTLSPIKEISADVLIIGGGPTGLSAAIELGKLGVQSILIDDKNHPGGKLVFQTHRFFGSTQAVYAGTRGIDIAKKLEDEVRQFPSIQIWTNSPALAVFSDQKVGINRNGTEYVLVKPKTLLIATGAREKFLNFKGNTLPGVFGAGAFQTLVNRDLVKPSQKLFIIGGGNVGLIAGYHALQAGIGVVGLVEVLPKCGGYKVHKDKLVRMGVPIMTSHTILSANGNEKVESVTIAQVDKEFKPIPGTENSYSCDSVLIAVGLDPVNEFYKKAVGYGIPTFIGGDAEEIAEASAAIFSGKIRGREIAQSLGHTDVQVPASWYRTAEILKSKPGVEIEEYVPEFQEGVIPVFHCTQEIPCNPCSTLCPHGLIFIDSQDIRQLPTFLGNGYCCEACEQCVIGCPGLAITLIDYRKNPLQPIVSIPYEFSREPLDAKDSLVAMDTQGNTIGEYEVLSIHKTKDSDRTAVVQIEVPREIATKVAGIQVQDEYITHPLDQYIAHIEDDIIVCRCERVNAGEIRSLIRQGYRDFNEIKTVTRAGMGACGGKTCTTIIKRIFREEGISDEEVTDQTKRPLFMEAPLELFAGNNPLEEN
jgi:NADPH-dependent 2,4-dienoyl-CoA reductase/sulfur reductase-like enzyme/ferredoxin